MNYIELPSYYLSKYLIYIRTLSRRADYNAGGR